MKKAKPKASAFSRVFQRGQNKVPTTPQTQSLLFTFSHEDHKRIAKVIQNWLEQDKKPPKT